MQLEIPERWRALKPVSWQGVVLVIGGTDTGKSTLTHYLAEQLRAAGRNIAHIDGDPGQNSLAAPASLACRISTATANDSIIQWFVGSTTPSGHMLPVIVGAQRLKEAARQSGADVILYDTSGFIDPVRGGMYLKQAKIDTLQPSLVIALQQERELELLLKPLRHHPGIRLVELTPVESVRSRNMTERRDCRTEKFAKAFREGGLLNVRWTSLAVWPRPYFDTGRLVAFCDSSGFTRGLGVVFNVEPEKREITVKTTLRSLEGIFALKTGSVRLDLNSFSEKHWE